MEKQELKNMMEMNFIAEMTKSYGVYSDLSKKFNEVMRMVSFGGIEDVESGDFYELQDLLSKMMSEANRYQFYRDQRAMLKEADL